MKLHKLLLIAPAATLFAALFIVACSSAFKPPEFPNPPNNLFSNSQLPNERSWQQKIIPQACAASGNRGDVKDCIKKGAKQAARQAPPAVIVYKMCAQLGSQLGKAACYQKAADTAQHPPLLKWKNSCSDTQKTPQDFVACMKYGLKEQ